MHASLNHLESSFTCVIYDSLSLLFNCAKNHFLKTVKQTDSTITNKYYINDSVAVPPEDT